MARRSAKSAAYLNSYLVHCQKMDFRVLLHGDPYDALTRPVPLTEAQQKSKNQSKIPEATSILPAHGLARGDRQGWVEAAVLSQDLDAPRVFKIVTSPKHSGNQPLTTSCTDSCSERKRRHEPAPEPESRVATYPKN